MPAAAKRPIEAVESRDVMLLPLDLPGTLRVPQDAFALVVFAHGSGSSRLSPRNIMVSEALNRQGIATLLFDLLTPEEENANRRAKVFDVPLLASRLELAIAWAAKQPDISKLPIGLFGASTGAAAALVAAAHLGKRIGAVVSRGGRPDMAGPSLPKVKAPTLLIVGGADYGVIELNEEAHAALRCEKKLEIVPEATHLFPEPGALAQVMNLASNWFTRWLGP